VGCLNHNLQHDTSQNPSESPTTTTTFHFDCEAHHISGWGCILMTTSHKEGSETHDTCMKYTCYEDEVGGVPQS